MARNVNLFVTDIESTDQTVQVNQYAVELTAQWTGVDGQAHERTETVRFPNILAQVPNSWLREHLGELIIKAARETWGAN